MQPTTPERVFAGMQVKHIVFLYDMCFADGMDQCFAELVLELQNENPDLKLIAALSYRKRVDSMC